MVKLQFSRCYIGYQVVQECNPVMEFGIRSFAKPPFQIVATYIRPHRCVAGSLFSPNEVLDMPGKTFRLLDTGNMSAIRQFDIAGTRE